MSKHIKYDAMITDPLTKSLPLELFNQHLKVGLVKSLIYWVRGVSSAFLFSFCVFMNCNNPFWVRLLIIILHFVNLHALVLSHILRI